MLESYLGIDVSKSTLDVHLLGEKAAEGSFENSPKGFERLRRWVQTRSKGSVKACLESTGCYSYGVAISLLDWCELVCVENPRRVKSFGQAMGILTKTDKVDARVIAEYAQRMPLRQWRLASEEERELLLLVRRLSDLDSMAGMESNRLEDPYLPERVRASLRRCQAALLQERQAVIQLIRENMATREKLKLQIRTLSLLPGMGELTALRYMAFFGGPEGYDSAEDVPAYCGLYPVLNQSGSFKGRSTLSKHGDPFIRGTFHMPAIAASRHDPLMRDFRQRLEARGLNSMAAIQACKRKILMQSYGVLKALEQGKQPTGLNHRKRIHWLFTA